MDGFFVDGAGIAAASVSGFIAVGIEIENDRFAIGFFGVVFGEDGFGDDVFFGGPIAEVAVAAAFAAEREVAVDGGVGGGFTNGAFVFHDDLPA